MKIEIKLADTVSPNQAETLREKIYQMLSSEESLKGKWIYIMVPAHEEE